MMDAIQRQIDADDLIDRLTGFVEAGDLDAAEHAVSCHRLADIPFMVTRLAWCLVKEEAKASTSDRVPRELLAKSQAETLQFQEAYLRHEQLAKKLADEKRHLASKLDEAREIREQQSERLSWMRAKLEESGVKVN